MPLSASEPDDSAWKLAQLATSLLPKAAHAGQSASKDWVWAEDYFTEQVDEALSKARLILDRASRPARSEFHLYEYFQPGEVLNPNQICRRLDDIGWWSTSRPTLFERLDTIQKEWSEMLDRQQKNFIAIQDQGRQALMDLEKILDEFCRRDGVTDSLPRVSELSRKLLSELHRGWIFADEESHTVEHYRNKTLYDWCFAAEKRRKTPKAKKYRFHELLRVAADRGWLPTEFESPVGSLSAGTPPFYAIPKHASFAAFNGDGVKSPGTLLYDPLENFPR